MRKKVRETEMTEHSAQHMFLLRPLLLQGLFDQSEFFPRISQPTACHTPEALSPPYSFFALTPSKAE